MTNHRQAIQRSRNLQTYEYYTQYIDIEDEIAHYFDFFIGKVVLCNCDDAELSNFFRYFYRNFERLRLKKLVTTCYQGTPLSFLAEKSAVKTVVEWGPDGIEVHKTPLRGSGSWDSAEVRREVESCDVIVTNPAFNQFKEFATMCINSNKHFIIVGPPLKALDIYDGFRDNKIWSGATKKSYDMRFEVPESYLDIFPNVIQENGKYYKWVSATWFTNIQHDNMNKPLILTKKYDSKLHPTYDNYPAIECKYLKNIPYDYYGVIGTSMTYLLKHNPEQFEIVGVHDTQLFVNGQQPFTRVLIRRKNIS